MHIRKFAPLSLFCAVSIPASAWAAVLATPQLNLTLAPITVFNAAVGAQLDHASLAGALQLPVASPLATQVLAAATSMVGQAPIAVLRKGDQAAVVPQAYTPGARAVFVDAAGKSKSAVVSQQIIDKVQGHLKDGNVGLAYQALAAAFDGTAANDGPVVPAGPRAEDVSTTALTLLKGIARLGTFKSGGDNVAAVDQYSKWNVDAAVSAVSASIPALIKAGKWSQAADLIYSAVGTFYYPQRRSVPDYRSYYSKQEVDAILGAAAKSIQLAASKVGAPTGATAENLAAAVTATLNGIGRLGVWESGSDNTAARDQYVKSRVDNALAAIAESVTALIKAGQKGQAADLIVSTLSLSYYPKGWGIPDYTNFYTKAEVVAFIRAAVAALK